MTKTGCSVFCGHNKDLRHMRQFIVLRRELPRLMTAAMTGWACLLPLIGIALVDFVSSGLPPFARYEEMRETADKFVTPDGRILKRVQHFIDGYPVWNSGGVMSETAFPNRVPVRRVRSALAINHKNPKIDIYNYQALFRKSQLPSPALSHQACRNELARRFQIAIDDNYLLLNTSSKRYLHHRDQAKPSRGRSAVVFIDEVSVSSPGLLYHCLVDVTNREVILVWDGLVRLYFNGGNIKTGPYKYGQNGMPSFPTYQTLSRGWCAFESNDKRVEILNARSDLSTADADSKFNCSTGPNDGNNGGYGPMADTFFNAVRSADMYLHPKWGGLDRVVDAEKLRVVAHYGVDFDDAHFRSDTKMIYLGDGGAKMYPLGTCLDLVAHEIGHAVTDMFSDLIYLGESGCVGEGFSDAVAEMAELYVTGRNDFIIGSKCMKMKPHLRNMTEPVRYSDYFPKCRNGGTDCQESHKCAAIVDYIFYRLATSKGWTTQSAGRAFLLANRLAWQRQTTIRQAGCDIVSVVKNVRTGVGSINAVINAFAAAGVDIANCGATPTTTSIPPTKKVPLLTTTTFSTAITKNIPSTTTRVFKNSHNKTRAVRINNCSIQSKVSASALGSKMFVIEIPQGTRSFTVTSAAPKGIVKLYFRYSDPPSLRSYDHISVYQDGKETISAVTARTGIDAYIMMHTIYGFSGLWMHACFFD